MPTWATPTPTTELRPGPGGAIDVHLNASGRALTLAGASPELYVTACPPSHDCPILTVAPELVPDLVACLRSILGALEAL